MIFGVSNVEWVIVKDIFMFKVCSRGIVDKEFDDEIVVLVSSKYEGSGVGVVNIVDINIIVLK